jgi:hypothetical protein
VRLQQHWQLQLKQQQQQQRKPKPQPQQLPQLTLHMLSVADRVIAVALEMSVNMVLEIGIEVVMTVAVRVIAVLLERSVVVSVAVRLLAEVMEMSAVVTMIVAVHAIAGLLEMSAVVMMSAVAKVNGVVIVLRGLLRTVVMLAVVLLHQSLLGVDVMLIDVAPLYGMIVGPRLSSLRGEAGLGSLSGLGTLVLLQQLWLQFQLLQTIP